MLLFLVVILVAGPVLAQDTCTIGNTNDPVGAPAPDIFFGNESYAYHVYPPDQCTCTEGGFTPLTVSQALYFDTDQVPATLQVEAMLLAAEYDPGTDCYKPGAVLCQGLPQQIAVTDPGPFIVTAPVDACPVQPFFEHYFLALRYTGNAPAMLPTDGQPRVCTEYIDRGNGWEDMFFFPGKTGGGKSIIFGDIVCGTLSVENQPEAWGAIKSLYR